MPQNQKNFWFHKIAKLIFVCIILFVFFAYVGPFIEVYIPAWKRYNQIQEEQNLDSGALYYSNVPQTQEAEENMRRAIKEAMDERRVLKQKQLLSKEK